VDGLEQFGVDGVGLPGRAGDVPAVHHDLVERDHTRDLARQIQTAGLGHSRPRLGLAPRRGESVERRTDAFPPITVEIGRVRFGRWASEHREVSLRRRGEGERERADMVQERAEGDVGRRRVIEGVIGYAADQFGHPHRGRCQVHRHQASFFDR
jgi:hypothetical protein